MNHLLSGVVATYISKSSEQNTVPNVTAVPIGPRKLVEMSGTGVTVNLAVYGIPCQRREGKNEKNSCSVL